MIGSLLIANRGEIARRIIRTARRMGIRTIAVFSEADAGAPHVREADEAVLIGPAPAIDSYLRGEVILNAARRTGAEAVHPGYGFLSENARFAEAVLADGRTWVGAPPHAIRAMGLKDAAKRLMAAAGVPVTPGYLGDDQSPSVLAAEAAAIGWPVLIKAVAGGGGKGMRAVHASAAFDDSLAAARREAMAAFGDDRVLLESLITSPRHIEVQVFADTRGGVVHLFERDCSLQRRHQKVIEEAPAPGMDAETRLALCDAAVRAARAIAYQGAGTVEFIADGSEGLRPDRIWFMEMNTRLQVEHPVTEAVTGLDRVEWQLRVAAGEPLPLSQDQIRLNGWAVEGRLYAEDPAHGFLPSIGPLRHLRLPDSVRVDSGVESGGEVTSFYDPMIAKLIAHGTTREAAIASLVRAAEAVEVWPVKTNAGFLARCAGHADFRAGLIDTGFIDRHIDSLVTVAPPVIPPRLVAGLAQDGGCAAQPGVWDPATGVTGFRLNGPPARTARLYLNGVAIEVGFEHPPEPAGALRDGDDTILFSRGSPFRLSLHRPLDAPGVAGLLDGVVVTPMPGRIAMVAVAVGDEVRAGQPLVIMEAMKMEHVLTAHAAGAVAEVRVAVGDQVSEGFIALRLDPLP